jgi:hypothetical protein
MGPKLPALLRAQSSRAVPIRSRNGAVLPCKKRIVAIPRGITTKFSSQKKRKQVVGGWWSGEVLMGAFAECSKN